MRSSVSLMINFPPRPPSFLLPFNIYLLLIYFIACTQLGPDNIVVEKCGMIPASSESFILWNELNTHPSKYTYGRVNILKDTYTLMKKPVPGDFDLVQLRGKV